MRTLLAGLLLLCVAGCTSSDPPKPKPTQPTSTGFSGENTGAPACTYRGGCDGDIHPSSGRLAVDGHDCGINGSAATMHMDPDGADSSEASPGWVLDSDGGSCGAFSVAGTHADPFPQKSLVAWGKIDRVMLGAEAATQASLTSGPTDHTPHAIKGTATVSGHALTFTFYFGDEAAENDLNGGT